MFNRSSILVVVDQIALAVEDKMMAVDLAMSGDFVTRVRVGEKRLNVDDVSPQNLTNLAANLVHGIPRQLHGFSSFPRLGHQSKQTYFYMDINDHLHSTI